VDRIPPSSPGSLRIGELADRTGLTPALLRAWERRYGVLQPVRTPAGYRLYSEADEARIRSMQQLLASGVAPREAAGVVIGETGEAASVSESVETGDSDALRAALKSFDESAAQAAFDALLARYSTAAVVCDIVLPYLADLGRRWLLGLARGWDGGRGPCAVLACPGGERHDIGLIGFGLVLRALGWRVALLGADTPDASVAEAATQLQAAAVVVGLTVSRRRTSLRPLAPNGVPLAVGGHAATAGVATRAGAERLVPDMRAAATQLDRLVGARS
jgi:DNA-binding transcriptional MerR regulator